MFIVKCIQHLHLVIWHYPERYTRYKGNGIQTPVFCMVGGDLTTIQLRLTDVCCYSTVRGLEQLQLFERWCLCVCVLYLLPGSRLSDMWCPGCLGLVMKLPLCQTARVNVVQWRQLSHNQYLCCINDPLQALALCCTAYVTDS